MFSRVRSRWAALAGVALVLVSPPLFGGEPRPRFGLALSGGNSRGLAEIGVLRALEENGLAPDLIAGTSMGSLLGALYASGLRAPELEAIVRAMDWNALFGGRPDRELIPMMRRLDEEPTMFSLGLDFSRIRLPASAFSDYRVNRFLIAHLSPSSLQAEGDFDRLPIPFRAVATDLANLDRVILGRGDLARAVRASVSIPLVFPPVELDGRRLVDGGVVDNLPVDVARSMGADVVLSVDSGSPPPRPEDYTSLPGIANQISYQLMEKRSQEYAARADFEVRPDIGRRSAADFSDVDQLIRKGYEAGLSVVGALKAALGEARERALPPTRASLDGVPIVAVSVEGNHRLSEGLVRKTFHVTAGRPFSMEQALRSMDRGYATGLFESCWMRLEQEGEGLRVVFVVQEQPPNRLEVAAGYSDEQKARAVVRLRNSNTLGFGERASLAWSGSDAGEQLRLRFEGDRIFAPILGYALTLDSNEEKPRVFQEGVLINRADFDRKEASGVLVRSIGPMRVLGLGVLAGTVDTKPVLGLGFPTGSDRERILFAGYVKDSLDDLYLPRKGLMFRARVDHSEPGLGATREYWKGRVVTRIALPVLSRVTLQIDGLAGISDGDLPIYERFRVGGPIFIPGLHEDELWGRQAVAGAASLAVQVAPRIRAVVRGGAGNVWDERREVRLDSLRPGVGLGVVYGSPIGPLAADWGIVRNGVSLFTLTLGYP